MIACRPATVALSGISLVSQAANAQLDPGAVRKLGSAYAHMVAVAAEPEVAISSVDIDIDLDAGNSGRATSTIKGLHVPYYREFGREGEDQRWYVQGSLGHVKVSQQLGPGPAGDELLAYEAEWTATSGLLEGGAIYGLGHGWSLAPGLSVGVSRLENELEFANPAVQDALDPIAEGILYNWSANALISRLHAALRYDRRHGNFRFKGAAHLTYSHVDSFSESGSLPGFSDQSGAAVLKLDVSRRVNSAEAERPVYLIGHLGGTAFLGANRDELGFSRFGEVGVALGIDQYAAGILAVFGEDVAGLSLTFNYNY